MHTIGKREALESLEEPDIWYDEDTLLLFASIWNVDIEASDACELGWGLEQVPWEFPGNEDNDRTR